MKNLVHFISTGGTIDSVWDGRQDTIVVAEHSVIPDYIEGLKLHDELKFTEVCMKDSRSLTEVDLRNILKTVEESPATKVIITHGTYTMSDTSIFLQKKLKRRDQTIVLTGAMTPLKGFGHSDAAFNLGFAISKMQDLPPGVYLCMNGKVFKAEDATKNLADGKFYSVFSDKQ